MYKKDKNGRYVDENGKAINLKSFEAFKSNPSVHSKMKGVRAGTAIVEEGSIRLVDDSGVMMNQYRVLNNNDRRVVDTKPFLKVYNDSLNEIPKLSYAGFRILVYIWKRLARDTDEVYLDVQHAAEECEYKNIASVYAAIIDLLVNGFLYKATGEQRYYINAEMFFNGKRQNLEPLKELQEKLDRKK